MIIYKLKKQLKTHRLRREQYVEDNLENEIKPNIFKNTKDDFLKNIDGEIMLS